MANRSTRDMMEWRLSSVMADRRIKTGAELQRRLNKLGITVSSQQISRLTNPSKGGPLRLSSDLIYGLTKVLQCTAADLWVNPDHPEGKYRRPRPAGLRNAGEEIPQIHARVEKLVPSKRAVDRATGPKAQPYDPPPSDD